MLGVKPLSQHNFNPTRYTMSSDSDDDVVVDCEKGREMGCATYCCRLLVRLDPDERETGPDGTEKKFIEKRESDGLCVHCDPETHRCDRWETRPRACREYNCNEDPLLQVVLRDGFTSLTDLVQADTNLRGRPPKKAPTIDADDGCSDD